MKIQYRPEIDGLRAIAVFAVILYHSQITILSHKPFDGGFLGVDIFFVISGYLISSIILKELITTGSFSFKNFYERRIRRILPALLFVMLVSLPIAWICLIPENLIDFSKSILYSLGFSSNFYFHYSGQIYGAESGLLKPFLHTWSLSVEEQFYIIFPIVLLITFKYFRKYLIYTLIIGFCISLGLSDWGSRNHPSLNFYVLPTRGWELIAGSILAYFEITRGYRSHKKSLNLLLPTIGLFLIFHSIIFFNDEMLHPSLNTLSAITGVCLIIWFSNKDEIITKILSNKIFVFFGLISYSLYLFHYPIFAFSRELEIFNGYYKFLFIFLSIIVSIFSFYYIEKPFRAKKIITLKKLIIIVVSFIIFLIFFNFYIIKKNGIETRLHKSLQKLEESHKPRLHQKDDLQKVLLIGDSHSDLLINDLNKSLKKNNFSFYTFHTDFYLNNFNRINRKTKKIDKRFTKSNNEINKFLNENSNLIIILHYRWPFRIFRTYFEKKEKEFFSSYLEPKTIKTANEDERAKYVMNGLKLKINEIIKEGHKLILVYPVPELGFHAKKKLNNEFIKKFKFNRIQYSPQIFTVSYESFKKRNKLIFDVLDNNNSPNIYRVYPHKLFCNKQINDRCVANYGNKLFYSDGHHLSTHGLKLVVDEIMKEIEKIELKF